MSGPVEAPRVPDRRVQDLLVGYLQEKAADLWPGGDGLTVEDLVREYPGAVAAGLVPGRRQLVREHPELTSGLEGTLPEC